LDFRRFPPEADQPPAEPIFDWGEENEWNNLGAMAGFFF
jgi:hypothetical protein